jgi:hypothetical protein
MSSQSTSSFLVCNISRTCHARKYYIGLDFCMFGAILTLTLRGEHFSKTPQSTRDNEQLTQYHIDPYASSVARPNKIPVGCSSSSLTQYCPVCTWRA